METQRRLLTQRWGVGGVEGGRKGWLEEVTSRLSLKDEEKSARRSTGKCVPIRRNRMCKVLDSRVSDA